jgi:hypothetical protein
MATIVINALPSTDAVVTGWPAPRQPASGDDGALLDEAIRFHDLSSPHIKKGSDYQRLAPDDLARSLSSLRLQLHDEALAHLSHLMSEINAELTADQIQAILLESLPPAVAKRRHSVEGADRARAAVRALISADWRSPERDRLLSQHRKGSKLRRLEQLDPAANSLHALVSRPAVEKALSESFGQAVVGPWGGDRAISRPGRADSTAPGGGYVEAGESDVGLTEKLYEQLATRTFRNAHPVERYKPLEIPATVPGGPPFRLHIQILDQVEVIFREVLPVGWKDARDLPKPYAQWHRNIEALEARFLHACLLPKVSSLAIQVGLPWALVLAGVLRVYLTELVARLATVALPTQLGYSEASGYLGVALWEALSGTDAPHATRLGYLVPRPIDQSEVPQPVSSGQAGDGSLPDDGTEGGRDVTDGSPGADAGVGGADAAPAPVAQPTPNPLLQALKDWRVDPFINGWSSTVAHHQSVLQPLREMAHEPSLISRPDPKDKSKPSDSATLPLTMARWPRYPVCRFPGARRSEIGLDLHCGAYLTAQCQLFVADQILRVAIDDLGLPRTWNDKRLDEGDAVDLRMASAKPSAGGLSPAISIIAGSYLWGGSHPPHITHRDGATFDLRFGPDTVAWLPTEGSRELDKALKDLGLPTKKHPYEELEGVCLTRAQQDAKQQVASIFRSLVRDAISGELRRVYEPLGRAPSQAELAIYAGAEKRLSGTPHFSSTRSSQQIHAGYVALLLSAPTQVIFSSPIAHLRAMRAVRFGLAGTGSTVVAKAAAALRGAFFVFMPTNHWHHWHAQYSVVGGSGEDPTAALDRWRMFLPLWEALGVDLSPFGDYLENLPFSTADDAQIARVRTEREKLLEGLKTYSPDAHGREHLRNMFLRLSRSDPDGLIKPANAAKLSPTLGALENETEGALTKLVMRKLIAKGRRFLEAIGDEYLHLWGGDPTRDRQE